MNATADDRATMIDPVVVARGLDLTFQTNDGPVEALKDVNLTINKGDFVSFIGPSGCGKTTFLRVMAALEHPTGGTVSVNGMSPDEARRNRAYGYVFQAAGLYPWRTIAGNIKLPLEIMGFARSEQEHRVNKVLQLVDLEGFGKKFPWQLSGGMQQRASIARALAFDAEILLMDEPFGALDAMTRDQMNLELQRIWMESGCTIVLVTHSIREAVFLADRLLLLSPRPGRMDTLETIKIARPRDIYVQTDPKFQSYEIEMRRRLDSFS